VTRGKYRLGTYLQGPDLPIILGFSAAGVGILILMLSIFVYRETVKLFVALAGGITMIVGLGYGLAGLVGVEANSIVYPVERQTTLPLVKTDSAAGSGLYQIVGSPVDGTVFTVRNADGSYQQINSKRVKVFEDAAGEPFVVKQQAVYTHKDVYTPGRTPLCLKDVDSGCRVNGILNTRTPDDDAYELHVPAGSVKTVH